MKKILPLLVTVLFFCADSREQSTAITLTPCEVNGYKGAAKCGTYEVFENRATKQGRKISLKIVVFPATGANRASDPFFYIPGGPGSSATEDAPGISQTFAKIHERRDLVFVDQRGTGGSNPLNCDFYNSADPQSYLGYWFPLEDVKKCREQLEPKADLTLYTTPIAMDDLDEVRAAMGFERINIYGASYGTRATLTYLKRHPEHVRSILLQGVAPTNQFMPRDFAQANERALQGVLAECAADPECHKAFPNLHDETKAVLAQLLKGPVEVEVSPDGAGRQGDGAPGATASRMKVKLSRDLAAEAIRYMLYGSGGAGRVPLFLHRAAQGDFVPLASSAIFYRKNLVGTGSNGLYLSITCAEDLPWIKSGEGEQLALNTFLGDYRRANNGRSRNGYY